MYCKQWVKYFNESLRTWSLCGNFHKTHIRIVLFVVNVQRLALQQYCLYGIGQKQALISIVRLLRRFQPFTATVLFKKLNARQKLNFITQL